MPLEMKKPMEPISVDPEGRLRNEVRITYCSENCLLRNLPSDRVFVKNGQTPQTIVAAIAGERIWLPTASGTKTSLPITPQRQQAKIKKLTADKSSSIWSNMLKLDRTHLMPIHASCNCMVEAEVVRGIPMLDAQTTPQWLKAAIGKRDFLSQAHPIPFAVWKNIMLGLSEGLNTLHHAGLTHGDPYPFNVIIKDGEAIWVDFNRVSDQEHQCVKDLWTFLLFTVMYTYGSCNEWSPKLIESLAAAYSKTNYEQGARGLSSELVLIFSCQYSDIQPMESFYQCLEHFDKCFSKKGLLGKGSRAQGYGLAVHSAIEYFAAFMEWIRIGNEARNALEMERMRHRLVESEHMRLCLPKVEVDQARAQVEQKEKELVRMSEGMGFLSNEHQRLLNEDERKAGEIAELLKHSNNLEGQIKDYKKSLADLHLNEARINNELVRVQGDISFLADERDWLLKEDERKAGEIEALFKHSQRLEEQIANLHKLNSEHVSDYNKAEVDLTKLREIIRLKEEIIQHNKEAIGLLTAEVEKRNNDHTKIKAYHNEEMRRERETIAVLRKRLEDVVEPLTNHSGRLGQMEIVQKQFQTMLLESTSKLKTMESELKQSKKDAAESESHFLARIKDIEACEREASIALERTKVEYQTVVEMLQEREKNLECNNERLNTSIGYLHKEKEELTTANQALQNQIKVQNETINNYCQEIDEINHHLDFFRAEHERLVEAHTWFEEELERKQVQLMAVKEKVRSYIFTLGRSLVSAENHMLRLRQSRMAKYLNMRFAMQTMKFTQFMQLCGRAFGRLMGAEKAVNCPETTMILNINNEIVSGRLTLERLDKLIAREELDVIPVREIDKQVNGGAICKQVAQDISKTIPVMAREPLVSVLLPVYNHADMLPLAVESVRAQTYSNWEMIILDDGSTDEIEPVLEKYSDDPRIRIYRQENQRLPNALTHLHELAVGEFITWTSADNLMHPDMLTDLVAKITQDPECVMVYADGRLIDENGHPLLSEGYRDHNRNPEQPDMMLLPRYVEALNAEADNFINGCFLYRRRAQVTIGGYASDLNGLEDYDFFLRLKNAGRCLHVGNVQPLYSYRIHRRSMSDEIMATERDRHLERGQKLIEYDQARGQWINQRWGINFSLNLNEYDKNILVESLNPFPVDFLGAPDPKGMLPGRTDNKKIMTFIEKNERPARPGVYVRCNDDQYELIFINSKIERVVAFYEKGIKISKLAKKSRLQKNPERFFELHEAGDRNVIIGTHVSFINIDRDQSIEIINNHPDVYFALYDIEGAGDPAKGEAISQACANATYMGPRPAGVCYWAYADFSVVWCPPCGGDRNTLRQAQALALDIGCWLLYENRHETSENMPYAIEYLSNEALPKAWLFPNIKNQDYVLDQYLKSISPLGVMQRLLTTANAALQEAFLKRPDFGQFAPTKAKPVKWVQSHPDVTKDNRWIGMWVDTLDQGGLEEVVYMLAHYFRDMGQKVRILCGVSGGFVAERMSNEGFVVEVFKQNEDDFRAYLMKDPPRVIHSHYAKQLFEVPFKLELPVIETIHNTYAFYDEEMWVAERERSEKYNHLIAVSEMVREYYLSHHGGMPAEKVSVISNAADYRRIKGLRRKYGRTILGVNDEHFVFINIASYDGRKNQLGLLSAFNVAWQDHQQMRLLIMGNPLSEFYTNEVNRYLKTLACRDAVIQLPFLRDVGTYLTAADAFIIPSYFEGWSISATEAVYSGLPLIHTRCGSGVELCANGHGVIIDNPGGDPLGLDPKNMYQLMQLTHPQNTPDLQQVMVHMMEECEQWQRGRIRRGNDSITSFSINRMACEYLKVYDIVCNCIQDQEKKKVVSK